MEHSNNSTNYFIIKVKCVFLLITWFSRIVFLLLRVDAFQFKMQRMLGILHKLYSLLLKLKPEDGGPPSKVNHYKSFENCIKKRMHGI